MICEKCLREIIIPKLREDDIAILQYLYNENITLPQTAQHKNIIGKATELSPFKTVMALFRLECYDMVMLQPWSKASNYYLTEGGVRALTILLEKMEG